MRGDGQVASQVVGEQESGCTCHVMQTLWDVALKHLLLPDAVLPDSLGGDVPSPPPCLLPLSGS